MSGAPKFSPFRAWAKPHTDKGTNGDGLRSPSSSNPQSAQDRKADLKHAAFFVTVALLFVLVNHAGYLKDSSEGNSGVGSLGSISLTVSPPERIADGFCVRFLLSNRGNHSIFYPVSTGRNAPVGQIVARASPSSEWMVLSGNSQQGNSTMQESSGPKVGWIEMPPGGWADGEFSDPGDWSEEHAYAIFLKPDRNADTIRILSEPYGLVRKYPQGQEDRFGKKN